MLTYVYSGLIGFVFGAVVALLKFVVVWRPLFKNRAAGTVSATNVMTRNAIGTAFNIAALFTVYLLRGQLTEIVSWQAVLIGTAVALIAFGRLYPLTKVLKLVMPDEATPSEVIDIKADGQGEQAKLD